MNNKVKHSKTLKLIRHCYIFIYVRKPPMSIAGSSEFQFLSSQLQALPLVLNSVTCLHKKNPED